VSQVDELQLTLDAIDAAWLDAYGAADKSATPTAARNRVTLLAKDVKCGADNFRVANAAYVKADAELRALQSALEEAEGRCCPEDFGFEEWIGVLKKRDNVVAHTHLQEIVSLLLQTMVPIGPMRDRTDYPVELQRAIDFLHGRVAQSAVERRYANPFKVLTSEWQTDRGENQVTCHSRMVDGVLCRWWGDDEPPGTAKIDAAASAQSANAPLRLMSQCARHRGLPITVTSMAHAAVFYCPHCEEEGRKQAQP
jgi:hypothetical protein